MSLATELYRMGEGGSTWEKTLQRMLLDLKRLYLAKTPRSL